MESRGSSSTFRERVGLNGRLFIKPKYVQNRCCDDTRRRAHYHRIRVGRFIRKLRIDELPQPMLGSMSLVSYRAAFICGQADEIPTSRFGYQTRGDGCRFFTATKPVEVRLRNFNMTLLRATTNFTGPRRWKPGVVLMG
jgi:hypothetical protein